MINIDSNIEFGYELCIIIPYAYYLYKNNLLGNTISSKFTKELYYFSENHKEKYMKREGVSGIEKKIPSLPNLTMHTHNFNFDKFLPPPYTEIYKNSYFNYVKPILIINNKFNEEWGEPPINFLDVKTLDIIFNYLHQKYTIIYNRPILKNIINDGALQLKYNLNEKNLLDKYNIIDANLLYEKSKKKFNINNFNHFQLLLYSNCKYFISVQGGNCILASYFGGTNIIFAKKGQELQFNEFENLYKYFSNCIILHTNNYENLINLIKLNY